MRRRQNKTVTKSLSLQWSEVDGVTPSNGMASGNAVEQARVGQQRMTWESAWMWHTFLHVFPFSDAYKAMTKCT